MSCPKGGGESLCRANGSWRVTCSPSGFSIRNNPKSKRTNSIYQEAIKQMRGQMWHCNASLALFVCCSMYIQKGRACIVKPRLSSCLCVPRPLVITGKKTLSPQPPWTSAHLQLPLLYSITIFLNYFPPCSMEWDQYCSSRSPAWLLL